MSRYAVRFSPRALEDLDALSSEIASRILKKIRGLEPDPFPRGDTVKQLQGFDVPTYRLRVGDWRVIYRIEGAIVYFLRILHRSEAYR